MTVTFGLVLFELCLLRLVTAWGEGAIGIRPVDSRHVLFTESNLNEVSFSGIFIDFQRCSDI